MNDSDLLFMNRAIELSKRGFPAPNPRVGAVLVKNNDIVGEGFHEFAGGDHAEIVAIKNAKENVGGATLYVTLEPCNHYGKTPACTDAIIAAGVKRVVYAAPDPNPMAAGGDHKLKSKNITVESGLLKKEAEEINYIFVKRYQLGRPWVIAKSAISLDGRIATKTGESKWITGPEARKRSHELRAIAGCVLVGAGTIEIDNPNLTIRDVDAKNQPVRVVLDSRGELRKSSAVFTDGRSTLVFGTVSNDYGVETISVSGRGKHKFDLAKVLQELARRGVNCVLVEGGGKTVAQFFEQNLVDEIELHIAPQVFGNGVSWINGEGIANLADATKCENLICEKLGDCIKLNARVKR